MPRTDAASDLVLLGERLTPVLLRARPLQLALLFGSVVKGEARPESDLDVGIVPADSDWTLQDELRLASELTAAAGREVDLVRLDLADTLLRFAVAQHHWLVLAQSPSELTRFIERATLDRAEMAPLLEVAKKLYLRRLAKGRATSKPTPEAP